MKPAFGMAFVFCALTVVRGTNYDAVIKPYFEFVDITTVKIAANSDKRLILFERKSKNIFIRI